MARAGEWRGGLAAALAAVLLGGCAPTEPPRPTAPPWAADRFQPAATAVVDQWNAISGLAWSPGSRLLAVSAAANDGVSVRVDLLDPSGATRATIDAVAYAWIDDDHLMTLETPDADPSGLPTVVRIHDLEGGVSDLPDRFASVLGNGHGAVALGGPGSNVVSVWTAGRLDRAPIEGSAAAWSPGGSRLALHTRPPVALASTGGVMRARVVVVDYPGWVRVFDSGQIAVDERFPLFFSPDGQALAGTSADDGTVVFDLASGATARLAGWPFGWTPQGLLVLNDNIGVVRLRDRAGALAVPDIPAGLPVFGPNGAVAVLVEGDSGAHGRLLVGRGGAWRVIDDIVAGPGTPIAWLPDGSAFFVATGTLDANAGDDRLLRVEVP